MSKKTPPPKKPKQLYISAKSIRWNLCQNIAIALYYSDIFDAELGYKFNDLLDHLSNKSN